VETVVVGKESRVTEIGLSRFLPHNILFSHF
jgi:hypothetical protein